MKPSSTHTATDDGMAAAVLQFSNLKTDSITEFSSVYLTTVCVKIVHIHYNTQLTSFNRAKAEEVGWSKDGA